MIMKLNKCSGNDNDRINATENANHHQDYHNVHGSTNGRDYDDANAIDNASINIKFDNHVQDHDDDDHHHHDNDNANVTDKDSTHDDNAAKY